MEVLYATEATLVKSTKNYHRYEDPDGFAYYLPKAPGAEAPERLAIEFREVV
jgi:hypothetical protein